MPPQGGVAEFQGDDGHKRDGYYGWVYVGIQSSTLNLQNHLGFANGVVLRHDLFDLVDIYVEVYIRSEISDIKSNSFLNEAFKVICLKCLPDSTN